MRPFLFALALIAAAPIQAQEPMPDEATADRLRARETQLLDRVRALNPSRHEELMRLKATDPRAYMVALFRVARFFEHQGPHGPPASPELREQMEQLQAIKLLHPDGIDALSKREQAAVRDEIHVVAERIFEIRQAERRRRMEEVRTALADLEADVARRDRDRERLLDDFVEQVIRGPVDL